MEIKTPGLVSVTKPYSLVELPTLNKVRFGRRNLLRALPLGCGSDKHQNSFV